MKAFLEKQLQKVDSGLQLQNLEMLGGGCINSASKAFTNKGCFFIKWNSEAPENIFIAEAEGLKALKKATSILKTPELFLATQVTESTPGVLITEYLEPGKANDYKLGEGLAEVHRFTSAYFGFECSTYCGATPQENKWRASWVDFYSENRLQFLIELIEKGRGISLVEKNTYLTLFEKLPELLPQQSKPALVHGDLWSGNYMNTMLGPSILDPACSFSDREFEFGITKMFGGFSTQFWDAYHQSYPLEPGWKERNLLYQLYHYLNHYYLFGGGYARSAMQIAKRFIA